MRRLASLAERYPLAALALLVVACFAVVLALLLDAML